MLVGLVLRVLDVSSMAIILCPLVTASDALHDDTLSRSCLASLMAICTDQTLVGGIDRRMRSTLAFVEYI